MYLIIIKELEILRSAKARIAISILKKREKHTNTVPNVLNNVD